MPAAAIVATDPVALGATVTVAPDDTQVLPTVVAQPQPAPEFPGVTEEATPIFDALIAEQFPEWEEQGIQAAQLLAEPFEEWDLVERVPLPIEGLIEDLMAGMEPEVARTIEESVEAHALMHRVAKHYREGNERGEGTDDHDIRPADHAEGAEPAGGDAVAGPGDDDPAVAAAG